MFIGRYDITSVSMQLPTQIKALVCHNSDETYTVVINDLYSYETQQEALLHELQHITNRDYEKENAESIELEARKNFESK